MPQASNGNSQKIETKPIPQFISSLCIPNQDTLATIGALGREATSHSIPLLAQLIEGRLSRLHGQMQRLISQVSQ